MPSRKGIPNKIKSEFTSMLQTYMRKKRVNPFFYMVDLLADESLVEMVAIDGSRYTGPHIDARLKFQAAKELAQYLQPKLRSMIVTGDIAHPLQHLHDLSDDQLMERLLQLVHVNESAPLSPQAEE